MSHQAQRDFFAKIKRRFPNHFHDSYVLECGSLDVNGSLREFCPDPSYYLGIDIRAGKGVDMVLATHELVAPREFFNLVMSAEMLEHDAHWWKSLEMMLRVLRRRGLLALSMATTGREEHGTVEHPDTGTEFDGIWGSTPTYYRNLTPEDLSAVLRPEQTFSQWAFEVNDEHHDLYFWGVKA